jgi:flagellar basal body-associated protein FliL
MEQAAVEVPRVEKKGKGRVVGILVALVLVLSAGAAGAVFVPRLLAKNPPAKHSGGEGEHGESAEPAEEAHDSKEEEEEEAEEEPRPKRRGPAGEVAELAPIVVDTRASDSTLRHVKVQVAVELPKSTPAEEFKRLTPYAREAAISYLRTQEFDRLADPKAFDAIRKEIEATVIGAVGKAHARRVLIIDFVVQ